MWFVSCEILDPRFDAESPGLVFSPKKTELSLNDSAIISLNAFGIDSIASLQATIIYDSSSLKVLNVNQGEFFFDSGAAPIFVFDNDIKGELHIYVVFLGDKMSVEGLGVIANIEFSPIKNGSHIFTISEDSYMLDSFAEEVELESFGNGLIVVK